MARTTESEGDFDDEEDYSSSEDFEYHLEADDPGVFWCPKCGAEMFGDSTRCAKCGDYVTPGLKPRSGMPGWMWIGLILVGLTLAVGLFAAMRR